MREIITISMPPNMVRWVRRQVSNGRYLSLSDYFRDIVRQDQADQRQYAAERLNREMLRRRTMASSAGAGSIRTWPKK